jgi:hypothetical protein
VLHEYFNQTKALGKGQEAKQEIMLMILRENIDKIAEDSDRTILQKTLNQKNFNNQKRYASMIFEESGFNTLIRAASLR